MMKVKDVNDPPVFAQNPVVLHLMEEEDPGKVLFTPEVKDVDSDVSEIRWVLGFDLLTVYLLDFSIVTFKYNTMI